jgi:hypothetical protein
MRGATSMSDYSLSWTETRSHQYDICLPVSEVIEVFADHALDVLTDAITEAIENATYDLDRMGPVLEALRAKAKAVPDDDTLDDVTDVTVYLD